MTHSHKERKTNINRSPSLLTAVLSIGGLAIVAALAEDSNNGTSEWIVPSRAARNKNPIEASDASIAKGKAVYVTQCAACHGNQGKGDGPAVNVLEKKPGDLTATMTQEHSDGALFWKITEGNKPMPSYDKILSEEDRWHVINYLRTLAPKPTK